MGVGALCYVSFAMIAPHVTMGRMLLNMFTDIENAELLVVWGANPATDSPPLDMHRLEAARHRGADVVVIDPRRTETAVRTRAEGLAGRRLTKEGVLVITANRFRTQEQNRADALARLVELLRRAAERPTPRRPTKPSRAAKRRRVDEKTRRGSLKKLRGRRPVED